MKNAVSGKVAGFLGEDILGILNTPDRIESYSIQIHKSDGESTIAGYPIITRGRNLSEKQVEELRDLLLAEETYDFEAVKKCLFLPEYALQAIKGDLRVKILVCFSCEELAFVYGGKELLEDFDGATPRLKIIIDELFVN